MLEDDLVICTILEGVVRGLKSPALLRIHRSGFFGSDGEERSIETSWVFLQEMSAPTMQLETFLVI